MASTVECGLTATEKAHFLEHGYVLLKGAFSREFALNEVREQFAVNGMDADRPETWLKPRTSFAPTRSFLLIEIAPRVAEAVREILGGPERMLSGETITNSMIACCCLGEGQPWAAPDENGGWHKDGQFFRHFLDSPEQALLGSPLWSDVEQQGGGTFIAPESVGVMARFLDERPEAVRPQDFPTRDLMRQCPHRMEAVGEAGDYYLMHGYMMHSVSPNPQRKLRCISNTVFALWEPMQFNRDEADEFSLLEQGVLRGLGVEKFDFQPGRERVRTPDYTLLGNDFR